MSKSYCKKYNAGVIGNNVALIFIIVLISNLWIHKDPIVKYGFTVFCSIVLAVLILRIVRRVTSISLWEHKSISSLGTIDTMAGVEFERYVARLLKKLGYTHISLTEKYDYGIDIIAEKDHIRWGIQVKRNSGLVKAHAVRQAVTGLRKYNCNRAMVISNSNFSHFAQELAYSNNCTLIDRNKLARWIASS
jgi:restriction system protein